MAVIFSRTRVKKQTERSLKGQKKKNQILERNTVWENEVSP
jgi:hypothetical protein